MFTNNHRHSNLPLLLPIAIYFRIIYASSQAGWHGLPLELLKTD